MKIKKSIGSNIFDFCNITFMILFSIIIIVPFWNMIVLSLSTAKTSMNLTITLWPREFSLEAYKFALRDDSIITAYGVTIARTVAGTLFSLFCNISFAYGLSKKELPFRNLLTTFILIPMFFGGGLIPTYIMMTSLGLKNTFLIYILPGAVGSYNIILIRNYFQNMDHTLEEAAIIDGASNFKVMYRIVVPMAKPIIATVALWGLVGHWNAWNDCLIYIENKNLYTLQFMLRRLLIDDRQMTDEMLQFMTDAEQPDRFLTKNLQSAITIITIAPIMATYPFLQKYFVKGIMIGALKG